MRVPLQGGYPLVHCSLFIVQIAYAGLSTTSTSRGTCGKNAADTIPSPPPSEVSSLQGIPNQETIRDPDPSQIPYPPTGSEGSDNYLPPPPRANTGPPRVRDPRPPSPLSGPQIKRGIGSRPPSFFLSH